jgi:hypothetical protein
MKQQREICITGEEWSTGGEAIFQRSLIILIDLGTSMMIGMAPLFIKFI